MVSASNGGEGTGVISLLRDAERNPELLELPRNMPVARNTQVDRATIMIRNSEDVNGKATSRGNQLRLLSK